MRQNPYKKAQFEKWLREMLIGAGIIFMTILIVVIVVTMQQSEQLYYEGVVKSTPVISNEKIKILGDTYIELNREFEQEIKELELNYANRYNKRGDKIHYGVNGKENDMVVSNNDYVNGIESVIYIKGKDEERLDGDSNFNDMISFLSVALGEDIDRYSEEELKEMFIELFKMTHTFSGESTELYPCENGCSFSKYYCGDVRTKGEYGEEVVSFYKSDLYMGKEEQNGLMYDPFLIKKRYNYQELKDLAGDETEMKTVYQYKDLKVVYGDSGNENHTIVTKGDRVVSEDDEIFLLNKPEGFCYVCSGNRQTFTHTTKKIGGCITKVKCYCNNAESKHLYNGSDDDTGYWVDWYMGKDKGYCIDFNVENANCNHECECEGECTHICEDPILLDTGYYVCNGHDHYACPGHIIVCCFGHTNLKLDIKIMYYRDMIETLYEIFK